MQPEQQKVDVEDQAAEPGAEEKPADDGGVKPELAAGENAGAEKPGEEKVAADGAAVDGKEPAAAKAALPDPARFG